jgi:death-on-curing protein
VSPVFLTLDEIVAIHRDQIERYGGAPAVRDWALLKSAVAMPAATYSGEFLHSDLCSMAAAYLFHLAQNHAFLDGNKRVAAVAADVFLALNGLKLVANRDEFFALVLAVASGRSSKSAIAEFFRANVEPR